jgi:RNA polymerase sigma factor (sigma-70 family)
MDTLAQRSRWAPLPLARAVNDEHVQRPRQERLGYIYHPSFDDPGQEAAILAPMPGAEAYDADLAQAIVPKNVPPHLAPLYTPLLNKDQERHLFRKMNFLKHQAHRLRNILRLPSGRTHASDSRAPSPDAIEELERQTQAIKSHLIRCNMRLAVSIAKRHATRTDNFSELLSDGIVSLISAVEKFDYSRGYKFSTYASCVIMRNYAWGIIKERRRRKRYLTGHAEWLFEATVDSRSNEQASRVSAERTRDCTIRLLQLLQFLDPREQEIVRLRIGLHGNAKRVTLEDIGRQFGISKERVRQLQARAFRKLRNLAAANNIQRP